VTDATSPSDEYLDMPLRRFLGAVAAREPTPGGGAVAATTVALAAGLAAMAARFSAEQLDDARGAADAADRLRTQVAALAREDAEAYAAVLAAYRSPRDTDPTARHARIRKALGVAADVPLRIAEAGAEVAALAQSVRSAGNPNLQGDASTAALLAEAATRAATGLVAINVEAGGLDATLLERAQRCCDGAARVRAQIVTDGH
jgi:formiminotetrahydrofolate cyclodeaminase